MTTACYPTMSRGPQKPQRYRKKESNVKLMRAARSLLFQNLTCGLKQSLNLRGMEPT